jgi:oligoendopeptidase F
MDYAYENIYGREYTPDEVSEFRSAILTSFKPVRATSEAFASKYATDTALATSQISTFMPFVIRNTVPEMISSWQYMVNKGLYDFEISKNKANTSYVTTFSEYDDAYLFLNASGSFLSDFSTIVHEFGHYNEKFMSKEELKDPSGVRSYDLAETHSQAFELITLPSVKKLIDEKCKNDNLYKTYAINLIYNGAWAVLSNCAFDEFEYAIYNAKSEELTTAFVREQFNIAWAKYWGGTSPEFYQVPHFFSVPAYCISYAVSFIFSAEIWASDDPIANYLTAVEYGSYNYLSTVYTAMGLESPLAPATVDTISNAFSNYIQENIAK